MGLTKFQDTDLSIAEMLTALPTDEELKEAYTKAYPIIRIYPDISQPTTTPKQHILLPTTATAQTYQEPEILEIKANDIQAIKQALIKGYKHADTIGDVRLYLRT
jgi:hypothetical protein